VDWRRVAQKRRGTDIAGSDCGALKLALRRVSERFNAAEVESIEVKKYPWFVVAKVKVYPYQIQVSTVLSASDGTTTLTVPPPAKALAIPGNQVVPAIQ
jgi:hypothetical protein